MGYMNQRSHSNSGFQNVLRLPPLAGPNVEVGAPPRPSQAPPSQLQAFHSGSGEVIRVRALGLGISSQAH